MKPTVIDPKTTTRAEAYALWMNAPNPMVTFFKTLDVTPLVRFSRKRGLKFNMLLCWCIGKAAGGIKEFYTLPVGRELLHYDSIAVNTIVKNKTGEVSSCDVPFSTDLAQFNADYLRLTRTVAESCENHDLPDSMVIGTSAIVDTEIDGAVGMNSGIFNKPRWTAHTQGGFYRVCRRISLKSENADEPKTGTESALDGTVFRSVFYLKRGLSIAKLLAEKMGGTITAEYENGRLQICIAFL